MKLKKIASLALAGVMAVSMLAGCAGKTGTTEDGTKVEVTTSSIVTALNDGQSADNDVKVTFSGNSALDATVQKIFDTLGTKNLKTGVNGMLKDNDAAGVRNLYVQLTGEGGTLDSTGKPSALTGFTPEPTKAEDETVLYVLEYDGATYWEESDVVNQAARDADKLIAKLVADNSEGKGNEDTFYHFSYTGNAGMVTVKKADGATYYYIYGTITRTSTEDEVKA